MTLRSFDLPAAGRPARQPTAVRWGFAHYGKVGAHASTLLPSASLRASRTGGRLGRPNQKTGRLQAFTRRRAQDRDTDHDTEASRELRFPIDLVASNSGESTGFVFSTANDRANSVRQTRIRNML